VDVIPSTVGNAFERERAFRVYVCYPIGLLQFSKLQIYRWDKLSKCIEMQDIGGMKTILLIAFAVSLIGNVNSGSDKSANLNAAKLKSLAFSIPHPRATIA
jgi:hypothetical protein